MVLTKTLLAKIIKNGNKKEMMTSSNKCEISMKIHLPTYFYFLQLNTILHTHMSTLNQQAIDDINKIYTDTAVLDFISGIPFSFRAKALFDSTNTSPYSSKYLTFYKRDPSTQKLTSYTIIRTSLLNEIVNTYQGKTAFDVQLCYWFEHPTQTKMYTY